MDRSGDHLRLRLEPLYKFDNDLLHQISPMKSFASLHDSNDGTLRENFTVVVDVFQKFFAVNFSFSVQCVIEIDANSFAVELKLVKISSKFLNSLLKICV